MLYQGVGWIRPTRLAPEGSPFFAVPGGSLAGLSDLMTEVPLNGRLAGLGCEGNRQCAPCAAAKLDQNRRENMDGLRGAQMAMQDQPRGWGLGAFHESGSCPTSPGAVWAKCTAVEWANYAVQQSIDIIQQAKAIGGPGWFGTDVYYESFRPLQRRVSSLINEFATIYNDELKEYDAEIRSKVSHALTEANSTIKAVFDGLYEEGMWDTLIDSLRQLPTWTYAVVVKGTGETVVTIGHEIKDAATGALKTAGDALDAAASVGKWATIAIVAAAVLYSMSFLPRGRG